MSFFMNAFWMLVGIMVLGYIAVVIYTKILTRLYGVKRKFRD